MAKWFCELEKGYMNLYCCSLYINGELVPGLPDDVTYNELKKAVRKKTGIILPLCKSMIWQKSKNGKHYAFVDATQPCKNGCIVTLAEVKAGHKPDWSPTKESVDKLKTEKKCYSNNKCESCEHFLGLGDFGLCCDLRYELCYENTDACNDFSPK